MKKNIIFIIFSISAICMVLLASNLYNVFYEGPFLDEEKVRVKFGDIEFSIEKWKTADIATRASMAASLLKNKKQFIGKSYNEIWEKLGYSDSFYHSDLLPGYKIQDGMKSKDKETWQLVFLIDKENKVFDIRVRRQFPK